MFTWYWLADLCAQHGIPFVLGHALYMKAIHGGKTKNDRVDSEKIAMLLRGGMLPEAYAYLHKMRATRDLLRRRMYLVHHRAEALAHIVNTASQYNLPPLTGSAKNLISLGDAGLALATTSGKVILVHGIPGDYDNDGTVDADDHGIWNVNYGTNLMAADGNSDGLVDAADYVIWRKNVGVTLGGTFHDSSSSQLLAPEPATLFLLVTTAMCIRRLAFRARK